MREVGHRDRLAFKGALRGREAPNVFRSAASAFRAAWLSTVVHHLTDLSACALELRRTLAPGAPVMIRNSFPGRLREVELFRHFPAAAAVAAPWPALEQVIETFAEAGFTSARS